MSNHGFGLLNIISSIINEEHDSNDAAIARYLVSNMRKSDAISVSAITERAHVTRSAVRRFCNRLGYQSLSELKSSFSQLVFPSDFRHRDPNLSFSEYRAELDVRMMEMYAEVEGRISDNLLDELADEIARHRNVELLCTNNVSGNAELDVRMMEMYAEVEGRISDNLLDELADEIARHRNVELLCTNNVSGNLMRFQQELFFAGKIVCLDTQSNGKPPMRTETYNDSLVIVVSVSGMFARELDEHMWTRTAKKELITAFANKETASRFDRTFYLSGRGDGIDELGIYSKYAITYLFDLLSFRYITNANKETASRFDRTFYLSGRGDGIDELGIYSKYAITYLFDLLSFRYITKHASPGNPLFGPATSWPE